MRTELSFRECLTNGNERIFTNTTAAFRRGPTVDPLRVSWPSAELQADAIALKILFHYIGLDTGTHNTKGLAIGRKSIVLDRIL
jgi:hypothetical protein